MGFKIPRSLWVQGYTANAVKAGIAKIAFPVGTGIYRGNGVLVGADGSVPCGYRDIPHTSFGLGSYLMRSLWVQGYTAAPFLFLPPLMAFPVGTGIYRTFLKILTVINCVPCGYRDIPGKHV